MLQSSIRPHFVVGGNNSRQQNALRPNIVGRQANEVGAEFDYGAEEDDDDEEDEEDDEDESDDYDPEQNHGQMNMANATR